MIQIQLYNTKTRKKEPFSPIDAQNVRMYVCGPTVYDRAHIGNARPVIVFDVLNRLLRHVYGDKQVTYVRNFTDVDDKINATALARKEAGAPGTMEELISERTHETIEWYHSDMDAVGARRPDHEPRATAYIEEMIEMISELQEKGLAYEVATTEGHNSQARHVYLDKGAAQSHAFLSVDAFPEGADEYNYGDLSGRSLDEMIVGSRAEVGEGKKNPMDSVLWKPSTLDQPGWPSPWGFGRPGWHIECSAMARKLLGKSFDIHGGGLDLMFPHHENELAQSCGCDGPEASARYWMHNEMLQVEGKKMSKSLGNFFTVRDLLDQGVAGEVIRFVMLSTHYRKPMDWTQKKRDEAEATLRKWYAQVEGVTDTRIDNDTVALIADDLNAAGALAALHGLSAQNDVEALAGTLRFLGLIGNSIPEWAQKADVDLSAYADALGNVRAAAMETKDFSGVDAMKTMLTDAGVEVRMSKTGVELSPLANFDASKLDTL